MLAVYIFIALSFFSPAGFSAADDNLVFTQALKSFKSKDLTKSKEKFVQLLNEHPRDPVLLFNIGLVSYQSGQLGEAVAYWRKALYLKPGFSPAIEGLKQAKQAIPNHVETTILSQIYQHLSISVTLLICLSVFSLFAYLFVLSAIRVKHGHSSFHWQTGLVGAFFILSASLCALQYNEIFLTTKATILDDETEVFASPSEEAPSLVSFSQGSEVVILRRKDNWLQVRRLENEVGWITNDKIYIHSGSLEAI